MRERIPKTTMYIFSFCFLFSESYRGITFLHFLFHNFFTLPLSSISPSTFSETFCLHFYTPFSHSTFSLLSSLSFCAFSHTFHSTFSLYSLSSVTQFSLFSFTTSSLYFLTLLSLSTFYYAQLSLFHSVCSLQFLALLSHYTFSS